MYNYKSQLQGLGAFALSSSQVNDFLLRHPLVAAKVAETKSFMTLGLYDFDYNPATQWRFPGVIPPWGLQERDSKYGLVTVFPARDYTFRYSGDSPDVGTDKPDYTSPTFPGGVIHDVFGDIADFGKSAASSLLLPAVLIGVVYILANRRSN